MIKLLIDSLPASVYITISWLFRKRKDFRQGYLWVI